MHKDKNIVVLPVLQAFLMLIKLSTMRKIGEFVERFSVYVVNFAWNKDLRKRQISLAYTIVLSYYRYTI